MLHAYCLLGIAVYTCLSVTDFVQTYALIAGTGGQVYEANPIAAGWLDSYGWHGLAAYKAVMVFWFAFAVALLIKRNPTAGALVVTFGCTTLLLVAIRSHGMLVPGEV